MYIVDKEMAGPSGKFLDMNIINKIYLRILSSNGKNETSINRNYKKHLKELISKIFGRFHHCCMYLRMLTKGLH